jgi:hypothetical protein
MATGSRREEIEAVYVPWLHMHQPDLWWDFGQGNRLMGNLERMLAFAPDTLEHNLASTFCAAYKNPAIYARRSRDEGVCSRIVLDFSGTLLRSLAVLSEGGILDRISAGGETVGNIVQAYRDTLARCEDRIEIAGSTFFHCYLPTTPDEDIPGQIEAWREQFGRMFGQRALSRVRGFWPPEMGIFGDEERLAMLIRTLRRYGYQWILVPRSAVRAPQNFSTARIENLPHWIEARDGLRRERMVAIVRDTEFSLRQEKGISAREIVNGLRYRARMLAADGVGAPALAVGVCDGENSSFIRNEFFQETFLALGREALFEPGITSMTISEYLAAYFPDGPKTTVTIRPEGGSRIGGHAGWQEGERRRRIIREIHDLSRRLHDLEKRVRSRRKHSTAILDDIARARMAVWNCGTSCYVAWGTEFWFGQAWQSLRFARDCLARIEAGIEE